MEENRTKVEGMCGKKRSQLDIQAIMEAAVERRRKLIEAMDSDQDDDQPDENWSDD